VEQLLLLVKVMLVGQAMAAAVFMGREVGAAQDQSVKMEQQVLQGKVVTVHYRASQGLAHRILVVVGLDRVTVVLRVLAGHTHRRVA